MSHILISGHYQENSEHHQDYKIIAASFILFRNINRIGVGEYVCVYMQRIWQCSPHFRGKYIIVYSMRHVGIFFTSPESVSNSVRTPPLASESTVASLVSWNVLSRFFTRQRSETEMRSEINSAKYVCANMHVRQYHLCYVCKACISEVFQDICLTKYTYTHDGIHSGRETISLSPKYASGKLYYHAHTSEKKNQHCTSEVMFFLTLNVRGPSYRVLTR